jgi:hypothetical protein
LRIKTVLKTRPTSPSGIQILVLQQPQCQKSRSGNQSHCLQLKTFLLLSIAGKAIKLAGNKIKENSS